MLDRKFIVENAELVKQNCARRGSRADVDGLLALESQRKQQQNATEHDAPGEFLEFERGAKRVTQADHENQAHSGEQLQRGKERWITSKTPPTPDEMDRPEAREVKQTPFKELLPELARGTNHDQWLELGDRHW